MTTVTGYETVLQQGIITHTVDACDRCAEAHASELRAVSHGRHEGHCYYCEDGEDGAEDEAAR